ncbi:BZ3500_MvSof-1268-A1-R1_Chr11-3g03555 [Microbotryum saponariae]|uniref:BZ3500_MvSof-1268-A1-R1_Chr11-3g03555 protein n=1 Tax=Microbotryum saponariae TaxID=289078 RepID=A0A2X0KMS8_9BASI|nr:BZ3500_MvSof-1268-A1-R1_Chr11-3g03555 [Microbotryum saponariae]SDA03564.1 BZ3501_MvSof-1269-A2-R1_Chr11g03132 [Microbotryum saponariae]
MAKGKDYYAILGLQKDANEQQIRSAYKKKAMLYHPDRNPDNTEEASKKFKEVSEAVEVLTDSNKRAIYDQFGEEGLKMGGGGGGGGPPPGGAGGNPFAGAGGGFPPGAFSFSTSGGAPGGGPGGFQPSDPNDIFASLFGSMGGMGRMGGMGGGRGARGGAGGNPFAGMGGMGGMPGGPMDTSDEEYREEKPQEVVKQLPVSLEDLYKGATKKLKVTKKRRAGGEEANTLETDGVIASLLPAVAVKPGWKAGTKVRFAKAGHETATSAQDLVFVIEEKPHPTFKREGDDLIYELKVPLVDALTGPSSPDAKTSSITTLDGRTIKVDVPYPSPTSGGKPLSSGQVIKVPGEGMPISRKNAPKKKGDLLVKVQVEFPARLSASQVEGLRKVLA